MGKQDLASNLDKQDIHTMVIQQQPVDKSHTRVCRYISQYFTKVCVAR